MYTQCPNCRTIFQIEEDALQASLGIVRCGHCSERFDALRTLTGTLPADPMAPLPEHDPAAHTPTLTTFVAPDVGTAATPPTEPAPPDTGTAATPSGIEAWIAPQSGERARALIADAAGIPPEAIANDPAWQVLDVPVQARLLEQDINVPLDAAERLVPEPAITAAMPTVAEPLIAPWEVDAGSITANDDDVAENAVTAERDAIAATEPEDVAPLTAADLFDADAADAALSDAEPESSASAMRDEGAEGDPTTLDETDAGYADTEVEPDAAPALEPSPKETVAEPVYVPPQRRILRDGLWIAGCVVLALVLAGQIVWAQRGALVRDPATRAWALQTCAHIACRLPPIRDVGQLELTSRDIRHAPERANGLLITATVRNNAPFRQPWPVVVVRMTDIDNNVVAMRRFTPADYLHNVARRRSGIAPGATAAVAFAVVDPGKRATGFRFGFE